MISTRNLLTVAVACVIGLLPWIVAARDRQLQCGDRGAASEARTPELVDVPRHV